MNANLPNDPLAEARAAIVTTATLTGRMVPREMEQKAGELLADIWRAGSSFGVQVDDWQAVTSLPATCLDVLSAVSRRPKFEEDE